MVNETLSASFTSVELSIYLSIYLGRVGPPFVPAPPFACAAKPAAMRRWRRRTCNRLCAQNGPHCGHRGAQCTAAQPQLRFALRGTVRFLRGALRTSGLCPRLLVHVTCHRPCVLLLALVCVCVTAIALGYNTVKRWGEPRCQAASLLSSTTRVPSPPWLRALAQQTGTASSWSAPHHRPNVDRRLTLVPRGRPELLFSTGLSN